MPRATPDIVIRPYCAGDRLVIRRIGCDTGYLGQPIDPVFHDRDLFAAIFIDPYLDHAAEWALVAEENRRIVGYLTGAVCPGFERRQCAAGAWALLRALMRQAARSYRRHPRSRRFIRWLLTRAWAERPNRPAIPAHMHFNIENGFRGRHIAQKLWGAFEGRLASAGIDAYYGEVRTDRPAQVLAAYGRYGLTRFDMRRTTIFEPERPGAVWGLSLTKSLAPPPNP